MKKSFLIIVIAFFISSCDSAVDKEEPHTYYDLCCQNLELARHGKLAEEAFCHIQHSSAGLVLEWERDSKLAEVLSAIYYEAGHIALAQRYAFEANVCAEGEYNPEMLKCLVATNIIYGEYPVAKKYIDLLEKDRKYGAWAGEQRRFLWDDAAVEADPEYGMKRRCIPQTDFVSRTIGLEDMEYIIDANPEHRNSMDYLGVYYLLDCDFERFAALVEKYYGTPALPSMPRSFAEAVCMMSENNPGYWKRFNVDPAVFRRYRDFVNRLSTGLSMEKFNDSFWYYVMLMNQNQAQ